MRILIADDENPKLQNIQKFVTEFFPQLTVEIARSVKSAIHSILENPPDIILLDMSLPTFDIAPGEPGGRPQGFGGQEVLRYMDFRQIRSPVIVITQYEAFSEKGKHVDLSDLAQKLKADHARNFRGCVYYGALNDDWQQEAKDLMNSVLTEVAT